MGLCLSHLRLSSELENWENEPNKPDFLSSPMEIIRDAGMDIEAACGGCCACATCHIYVDEKIYDSLPSRNEDEESMLDQAFDVRNTSRLSCQINLSEDLDGIQVELAPE